VTLPTRFRRLRRAEPSDAGISMVELLVAMTIGMLVLGLATSTFIGMVRANRAVATISDQISSTTTPGQRIERALRSAVPLACDGSPLVSGTVPGTVGAVAAPTATDVSFFTPPLKVPSTAPSPVPASCGGYALQLVHLWVDTVTGALSMSTTPATVGTAGALTWSTANTKTVILGTGYGTASAAQPIFQYYSNAQAVAAGGGTPLSVPVAGVALATVAALDVTLRADLSPGSNPTAQVLTFRVRLANA
jgi:Tfp pilus assembly protein PilW